MQRSSRRPSKKRIYDDDDEKDDRAKQKKRKVSEMGQKVSEMLGPEWTEGELEAFYKAFRKHGRNWKKVAAAIRNNRTAEMVEALYNANQKYLSLPDGEASANGFIAMMTDQYDAQNRRTKPPSANGAAGTGIGPSPLKKPRTTKTRAAAGNKLRYFVVTEEADEKKTKNGKVVEQSEDENSNHYDFNNVVKAVTMTLADPPENNSESETSQAKENGKAEEDGKEDEKEDSGESDEEVAMETVKRKSRRMIIESLPKRPPSSRLKRQRELAEEAELGAVEDSKPQRTRYLPQRSKKRSRQLFSGEEKQQTPTYAEENSGLDTLATLADLTVKGLLPSGSSDSEDDGTGRGPAIQQILKSLQADGKKEDGKDKKQLSVSPDTKKKKKRPGVDRASVTGEASTSGKSEDKGLPAVNKNGRTRRVSTTKSLQKKHDDESERKLDGDDRIKKRSVNEKLFQREPARPHCPHTTPEFGASSTKARLLHILTNESVRRWCYYEWFYSAIDLPWYARNEFIEYLNHAGLGLASKLTRREWSVIRNSLGKPRRLSQKFLQEEREKLETYRDNVRAHYYEIRNDKLGSLPPDLAKPLTVGQRVIARHPRTGGLHDGRILTVDRNRCRVQFDSPELGVEFVLDINAMPVNPLENMSEEMRKKRMSQGRSIWDRPGPYANSQLFFHTLSQHGQMDNVESVLLAKEATNGALSALQQQQANHGHSPAVEADCRALAELHRQLEKKEALVWELRRMHDDWEKDESLKTSEAFQTQYATINLQFRDVNNQVQAALRQLRERNTYQENVIPPWLSPPPNASVDGVSGLGAGSPAEEITLTARKEAKTMVSAAVQAICCLKEGEDPLTKMGKALNKYDGQPGMGMGANHQQGSDKGDILLQTAGNEVQNKSQAAVFASWTGAYIPTELIASCIATILMIKTCTERPLPPSDIGVMFENALATLRPRSAQNHQLYKEIEQLLDVLKKQATATVFRPNMPLPL